MARRMPQEAIDRNIAHDLARLEFANVVPEGQWGNVKILLTWFRGNEMSMLADFFVDTMINGTFARSFYIDDRVSGQPVASGYSRGRVGKREVNLALQKLATSMRHRRGHGRDAEAMKAMATHVYPQRRNPRAKTSRPNPRIAGLTDSDRADWIDNEEGMYLWWKESRLSKREFVRKHRAEIDEIIARVMKGKYPGFERLFVRN
jgi:hypothetical protein